MTTRRSFVATAALTGASLATVRSALAQSETPDWLFVQSARGMTFDKATSKLTLHGVSPATVFFSVPTASPAT